MSMRTHDKLRKRFWRWTLGSLLLLASAPCGSPGPFAIVTLMGLAPGVASLHVHAQIDSAERDSDFSGSDPLDRFSLSFPSGRRGNLALTVSAFDTAHCLLANGSGQLMISADETYNVSVALSTITPAACAGPNQATLVVQKSGDGQGTITSSPPGIACMNDCPTQGAPFDLNTQISLSATPSQATGRNDVFTGWSGGVCSGTGLCAVTLTQFTTVTASFACRGFCAENPATEQNTLNAVWGTGPSSVMAVGDNGTILRWDGTAWKRVVSTITTPLRAISGTADGLHLFAVGDGGQIVGSVDNGATWATVTSPTTANLRSIWVASATEAYAVGDTIGGNMPFLQWRRAPSRNTCATFPQRSARRRHQGTSVRS